MRKVFFVVALMAAGFVMGQEPGFFLDDWQEKIAELPVHVMKEKADGSVSCVVGGLDLASRTQWRVDIRLPEDKA